MGVGRSGATATPSGATYTFLFTDVEGSTRRWQADPQEMETALADHDQTLQSAVEAHQGTVFKHTGDGICAVFPSAVESVRAALDAQRRLALPVRMAVHTGEALEREGDFFGVALSRCARLLESGYGGQVLLSASAASVAADVLGSEISLQDLGEHRLRDLGQAERIFQVVAPGLRSEFPRLRSLDAVRHNLPIQRSSFVGRQVELAKVYEQVLSAQLVTLTGIGGCGKTRLALEASTRLVEDFPEGAFFVDLALVSDPDLLGQAVAGALSLQLLDTGVEGLSGYLGARRMLLLLDNCEHVLDACANLVDGLLARCHHLHVLATSREALGLEGEQTFRVPSLSVDTDAVSLFIDRARAARPGLRLDSGTDAAIAEICRRLDGIPLAIELAAARTAHLAPAQIAARLSDRFRLLTGGRRRVQRQQTLAAAIDWSYTLLSTTEQMMLRRLAVFRGSFSLRAAEEICHPDALDLLGSLVAKSLVNLQEENGVDRYRLLETVRLYAEDRLVEAGEADQLRSAHRDWLLGWIESLPVGQLVELGSGDQLASEADNLTAALEWSLAEGRLDLVVRLASRMVGYWWSYVRVAAMAAWWDELEVGLVQLPPDLRAAALLVGVQHAVAVGDFDKMERLSAESLTMAPPDSWIAAYAWSIQSLYWTYADPERGKHNIQEGRRAASASGVPELDRQTASYSANLVTGDPSHDEALGVRELVDSLLAGAERGSASTGSFILVGMLADSGQTKTAARLASALPARSPLNRFGQEFLAVVIAAREGHTSAMSEHLRALTGIVRDYAVPLGELSCLVGSAALAVEEGEYQRASRLLATVRNAAPFPFRTPLDVLIYRRCVRAVRAALDPATARKCRADGAVTSVSEVLDAELARLDRLAPGATLSHKGQESRP